MTVSVAPLEKALSYTFSEKRLALRALTHSSASPDNNERLEFLGDAVLGFVIAAELCARHPLASEGELSRMRAALVNQQQLALLATERQIGAMLILGPGELKGGGRTRASILSDAIEAILGAIYLDGGLDACKAVILSLYAALLSDTAAPEKTKDPKTLLQELLQAKGLPLPVYEVLEIAGEDHQQTFYVACRISLLPSPCEGQGSSRKLAEQQAAHCALMALENPLVSPQRRV